MTKASQVNYSTVIAKLAERNDTDTTRAGKALRAKLRAMGDDTLCKAWPEFKASGKLVRDGNRYPTTMPASFAEALLAPRVTINDEAEAQVAS